MNIIYEYTSILDNLVYTDTNCIYIHCLMCIYTNLHLFLMAQVLLSKYFEKFESII